MLSEIRKNRYVVMSKIIFLLGLFLSLSVVAFDDATYANALQQTQNLLRNSETRKAAINTEPAKAADKTAEITALGDPAAKSEVYNIAADLMPWLLEQSQGDPLKMMQLIQEAQKNPQAFLQKMPVAERQKIKKLSGFIEQKKNARQPASASP
jgi:hypothetical protein